MIDHSDIHEECLIVPFKNGVKILSPAASPASMCGFPSVAEILAFPMNAYFQIPGGIMLHCNEEVYISHCANSMGFLSSKELIGISPEKICEREYAESIKTHDKQVIQNKQLMVFEENILPLRQEINLPMITFKFPCYLDNRVDPIIFGLSILLDNTLVPSAIPLAEKLSMLLQSGLLRKNTFSDLNTHLSQRKIGDVYVTKQQMNCLKYAIKGMTAKKIANQLGISFRTVEHHFEILKQKLKVDSKAELLEKILDQFIQ